MRHAHPAEYERLKDSEYRVPPSASGGAGAGPGPGAPRPGAHGGH
jgi:hypothetical protein